MDRRFIAKKEFNLNRFIIYKKKNMNELIAKIKELKASFNSLILAINSFMFFFL